MTQNDTGNEVGEMDNSHNEGASHLHYSLWERIAFRDNLVRSIDLNERTEYLTGSALGSLCREMVLKH